MVRAQSRKIVVSGMRNIDRYLSVFMLMTFIIINGCDSAHDKVIAQGEFAGVKIGQSKREALKDLGLHGITEIIPYYNIRVRIDFHNINNIHELDDERGICLEDSNGLSLQLKFNDSNSLIDMNSSVKMEAIKHGIKVGQSKPEVLHSLSKLVKGNRSIKIRDCVLNLFWVNPQEITEKDILYMSEYDMWRHHATDSFSYTDLYFSDGSLNKIVYHYRPNELSFLD